MSTEENKNLDNLKANESNTEEVKGGKAFQIKGKGRYTNNNTNVGDLSEFPHEKEEHPTEYPSDKLSVEYTKSEGPKGPRSSE
ncbi:MAG: hypothetical protein N4A46_12040 [Schleiferiaceae bacterium]|jgi:hypothetical protein|nr:hypothetical protein [Schleiferiaceae bacterium]